MDRLWATVLTLAGVADLCGQPKDARPDPKGPDVEALVKAIAAAKYQYSTRDNVGLRPGYRALFKAVGPAGLRDLQANPNDGVAIQAAWEQVTLTVPEKPARPTTPDAGKLAWFVGFVEGRARVRAPDWWAEAVRGAVANRRDNIYPALPKVDGPYHRAGLDGVTAPRDTTLERDEKAAQKVPRLTLRVGKETVRLPAELLERPHAIGPVDSVSACVTPTRCYLAVHDDVGYAYMLSCIDRESGKVAWTSRVWAHFWGFATGHHTMYVTVTEQGGRVFVFGASSTGIHVEAFQADDGAKVFRFASAY